jgi:hypothetical protein
MASMIDASGVIDEDPRLGANFVVDDDDVRHIATPGSLFV